MSKQSILIGLALAAGITIGIYVAGDRVDPPEVAVAAPSSTATASDETRTMGSSDAAEIGALRALLAEESRARRALERQLFELGQQVDALERAGGVLSDTAGTGAASDGDAEQNQSGWFDTQALIDNGMDDGLAGELQVFYEQIEMERLFLRDQSLREEWDRERYRAALGEIEDREQALRQRLGEEGYDAYLYASGQPNRVAVTSVLASAPAGQAGIEAGDHILRYDNQRIYSWFELREATAGGDIGDTVSVEVDRGGQTLQFYLARGPLGIRMNSLSVAP